MTTRQPESVDGDPADVLTRWHDAVNAGDIAAVLAVSATDVAVRGPRGVGHGHDLMRGWLERSGIRLAPQDPLVETDGRFVVRELAQWTTASPSGGAPLELTETWCVFTVAGGAVTSVARYETESDVPLPGDETKDR